MILTIICVLQATSEPPIPFLTTTYHLGQMWPSASIVCRPIAIRCVSDWLIRVWFLCKTSTLPNKFFRYSSMCRFFAHLCLFLQMIDIPVPPSPTQIILESYLGVLEVGVSYVLWHVIIHLLLRRLDNATWLRCMQVLSVTMLLSAMRNFSFHWVWRQTSTNVAWRWQEQASTV